MANTFALFPSRHNFKNSKKYTYTTSTRTPSWVTEVVSYAQALSTLERGLSHFLGNPGPMNVTFVFINES